MDLGVSPAEGAERAEGESGLVGQRILDRAGTRVWIRARAKAEPVAPAHAGGASRSGPSASDPAWLRFSLATHHSRLKRSSKIVLAVIALAVAALVLAIIIPSLPSYHFASVNEARSFGHFEDGEIVDELGDTNGPYKLRGGVVGGVGKPFDFNLTFNGRTTNWTQPVSNHMWFVASIFENRKGNQFAVIRKRTE